MAESQFISSYKIMLIFNIKLFDLHGYHEEKNRMINVKCETIKSDWCLISAKYLPVV